MISAENEAAAAQEKADLLLKKYGVEEKDILAFKIAGYFAWVRTSREDQPACEKYDPDAKSIFPDRKKMRALILIREWPLSATEFGLTLAQLVQRYPCPGQLETSQ
jgi:hypothetical protein